jgi:hypothetical protein
MRNTPAGFFCVCVYIYYCFPVRHIVGCPSALSYLQCIGWIFGYIVQTPLLYIYIGFLGIYIIFFRHVTIVYALVHVVYPGAPLCIIHF